MNAGHLRGLDLNLLVVLDRIYSEGSITRASQQLHLTQPAVSHALRRLREHFGDELFVRQGHLMRPTPLARSLIDPVRKALRSLDLALTELDRFDASRAERRFVIGVRDVLEARILPPLMQRVLEHGPRIELATVTMDRRTLELDLANGNMDAALDVRLPTSAAVRREQVSADHMVVVARRDHPVVHASLDLETYLAAEHVVASGRRSGTLVEDVELERRGLQRRIRLRCQHYFAACRVVARSDLLLTMPGQYAVIANESLANRMLPLPFEMTPLDVYLYWHRDLDRDPSSLWLREQIAAAFCEPTLQRAAALPGSR